MLKVFSAVPEITLEMLQLQLYHGRSVKHFAYIMYIYNVIYFTFTFWCD